MQDDRNGEFARKLGLALNAVNLSRAGLASRLGVDKSLVSRWTSGQIQPSNHNLARIGELFAELRPGFSNVLWSRSVTEFARFFEIDFGKSEQPAAANPHPGYLKSFAASRHETAMDGKSYAGIYVLFRQSMSNNGRVIVEIMAVWQEDGLLKFRSHDGFFDHGGPLLLIRQQLHGYSESERVDGLAFVTLHGVGGDRAMVLDGIMLSVVASRSYDPVATKIILLRIADFAGAGAPDWAVYTRALETARGLNGGAEDLRYLLPEAFHPALDNATGQRPDQSVDHVLRVPRGRSFSYADTERSNFDWPAPDLVKVFLG